MISSDYTAYYSDTKIPESWEAGGQGQINYAEKWMQYVDKFPYFGMTFSFTGGYGGSLLHYDKFRALLDMWERYGNTRIVPMYYQPYGFRLGSDELRTAWLNFMREFADEPRIVAIHPFGEPHGSNLKAGMSREQAIQWTKNLIEEMHSIKPLAKYVFPFFGLLYNENEYDTYITDLLNIGVPMYCKIDVIHPYYFPESYGWNKGLTPAQKVLWYKNNQLDKATAAFDNQRLWCGETFWWAKDLRKDAAGEYLQDQWLRGIINLFVANGIDFNLLAMTSWQTFHEGMRTVATSNYGGTPPQPEPPIPEPPGPEPPKSVWRLNF
jgi:hypothetical protein